MNVMFEEKKKVVKMNYHHYFFNTSGNRWIPHWQSMIVLKLCWMQGHTNLSLNIWISHYFSRRSEISDLIRKKYDAVFCLKYLFTWSNHCRFFIYFFLLLPCGYFQTTSREVVTDSVCSLIKAFCRALDNFSFFLFFTEQNVMHVFSVSKYVGKDFRVFITLVN